MGDWKKHIVQTFEVGKGAIAIQTLREVGTDKPTGVIVSVAEPGHAAGSEVPDGYEPVGAAVVFEFAGDTYESIISGLLVLAETFGNLAAELVTEMDSRPADKEPQ